MCGKNNTCPEFSCAGVMVERYWDQVLRRPGDEDWLIMLSYRRISVIDAVEAHALVGSSG